MRYCVVIVLKAFTLCLMKRNKYVVKIVELLRESVENVLAKEVHVAAFLFFENTSRIYTFYSTASLTHSLIHGFETVPNSKKHRKHLGKK